MSGIFSWAFKSNKELGDSEIPEIFPLELKSVDFVKSDVLQTFAKILTDVAERSHGLSEKQEPLLWDSAVQTNANEGLITLLARAMSDKTDLFIVYSPSTQVIRKATQDEEAKIRQDYKTQAKSSAGVWVSFKNYRRSEIGRAHV